jgi:hypothetical protein
MIGSEHPVSASMQASRSSLYSLKGAVQLFIRILLPAKISLSLAKWVAVVTECLGGWVASCVDQAEGVTGFHPLASLFLPYNKLMFMMCEVLEMLKKRQTCSEKDK